MNIQETSYPAGLLIVLTIVLAPTSVHSQEIPTRGPIPFDVYDKDGNSLVSEDEFNQARAARMSAKVAAGKQLRGAANAPSFTSFDTNKDGQLSRQELISGQKAQQEKRRGKGMGQGRGMGKGQGMGQGKGMGMNKRMGRNMPAFSDYDLNGDGKLLEAEFDEARSQRISKRAQQGYQMKNIGKAPGFSDIDADGNGEISSKEFAAHQLQHRKQKSK